MLILGQKVGGDPEEPFYYYNFSPRENCYLINVYKPKVGARFLQYHTDKGIYTPVATLDAHVDPLMTEGFEAIHNSNLVNMEKVCRIAKDAGGLYVAHFFDNTIACASVVKDKIKPEYYHLIE